MLKNKNVKNIKNLKSDSVHKIFWIVADPGRTVEGVGGMPPNDL